MEYKPNCNWNGCGCGNHAQTEDQAEEQNQSKYPPQTHVHEIVGSVRIAEECNCCGCECHNHRFATVSDEVICTSEGHVHQVTFRTDFYEDHYHEFCGKTDCDIDVGCGRHVHLLSGCTTQKDGHKHEFKAATLIEDPIGD